MDTFQKHYDYLTTLEKVDEVDVKTCCDDSKFFGRLRSRFSRGRAESGSSPHHPV